MNERDRDRIEVARLEEFRRVRTEYLAAREAARRRKVPNTALGIDRALIERSLQREQMAGAAGARA